MIGMMLRNSWTGSAVNGFGGNFFREALLLVRISGRIVPGNEASHPDEKVAGGCEGGENTDAAKHILAFPVSDCKPPYCNHANEARFYVLRPRVVGLSQIKGRFRTACKPPDALLDSVFVVAL